MRWRKGGVAFCFICLFVEFFFSWSFMKWTLSSSFHALVVVVM